MGALAELLGPKRAEQFREAVNQQLSADAVPANLDRLANPYGYDVIPGLMLPSDQDVRWRPGSRSVHREGAAELAEDFGTGIIDRYQWMQELSWGRKRRHRSTWGRAGARRTRWLSPQADFLEKVGGGVSGGGQAGYGQSGARGLRMEKTSKETGPVVELVLQYHASVEAISYVDTDAQVPLAFEIKRYSVATPPPATSTYESTSVISRAEEAAGRAATVGLRHRHRPGRERSVPDDSAGARSAGGERPELPLSEVLAQALDQESYAYDPGQALGSVIRRCPSCARTG